LTGTTTDNDADVGAARAARGTVSRALPHRLRRTRATHTNDVVFVVVAAVVAAECTAPILSHLVPKFNVIIERTQ